MVKHFAPYAAGSGISEIKCILGKSMSRSNGNCVYVTYWCFIRSAHSGLCNERIFGRMDASNEKCWPGMSAVVLGSHSVEEIPTFVLQALAVASNLSIGKEGPSVHMACCVGHVISRLFANYRTNKGIWNDL